MRYIIILNINILFLLNMQAQTVPEKIAIYACEYLDSIDNYDVLTDSIQPSLASAMAKVIMESSPEEHSQIFNGMGMIGNLQEAFNVLPSCCYNVRRLLIDKKVSLYYKRSAIENANLHYDRGNVFMEKEDYKSAIKEFKKAVKNDSKFVFAFDNLAISYRRLEKYKSAIKYYKKSLEIFPEGKVALLNIAVSYTFIKDDVNSIKNYEELKFLYPDNPEGYFGLAKMFFVKEDYERAVDNLFTAHRIYAKTKSDYIKDSEQFIGVMNAKLIELNRAELFKKKAEEYNILIEE